VRLPVTTLAVAPVAKMSMSGCGVAVTLGTGVGLGAGDVAVFSDTAEVRLDRRVGVAVGEAEVLLGRLQPARSTTESRAGRIKVNDLENGS